MNPRSIRFRLTAWYAAILALTFAVLGAGAWLAIRHSIHETVDADLNARMSAMREYLAKQLVEPNAQNLKDELQEDAAVAPAGTWCRIADGQGNWIYQSPGTREWGARLLDPGRGGARTMEMDGKPVRLLSAPFRTRADTWTIEIGVPVDDFYEMLNDFVWTAWLASPIVLLLASAGGYWMSRRALAPVDRIARTAQTIGAQNLSARLPLRGAGDELDRLSQTLNDMFARLESAFYRITQFTADASHELRTPVAVIRTTAELALRKPRGEGEYAGALDRILAESERTTQLLEDLMTLARADAGASGLVLQPMDLADSLRDACAQARVLAEAAELRFTADAPPACPVVGDYQALRRLLLILLDNAVKYNRPGGEIHVSTRAENGRAVVEVRDSGVGIAAEDLPNVFERFYRATKDRSRDTGGAGLGLSIAQWIAALHAGEIRVESAPGAGSLFRVDLPLVP